MSVDKPDFTRFLNAVTRVRLPDRVPNAEVEVDVEVMERFIGRPIANVRDHVEFWRRAGYDYTVVQVRGQPLPDHPYQQIIGQPDPNRGLESLSRSTFEGVITDEESFQAYRWIGPEAVHYGDVDLVKECLPEGMGLLVSHGPLFSGIWRAMGLERFSIACTENPALVEAVATRIGSLCVTIVENLLQREWVDAVWFGDDIAYATGLMVDPGFLRRSVFPYYARIGELCRTYRKPFIFHSDGDLSEVLEDLIELGVQAVHPNEPASADIERLKRQYADRLSFIGNVDVGLLARGTTAEVIRATRHLIEAVAPGGGFALGSGNSITGYCSMANYRAMLDTVKQFGGIY